MNNAMEEITNEGYKSIEEALRHIAIVRRALMGHGETAEDIDKFIAKKGAELIPEYEAMTEGQLIRTMIMEMLEGIKIDIERS